MFRGPVKGPLRVTQGLLYGCRVLELFGRALKGNLRVTRELGYWSWKMLNPKP